MRGVKDARAIVRAVEKTHPFSRFLWSGVPHKAESARSPCLGRHHDTRVEDDEAPLRRGVKEICIAIHTDDEHISQGVVGLKRSR